MAHDDAQAQEGLDLRLSVTTEESTSLARQERDLRELAEREGWVVAEVLSDDGISGAVERDNAEHALKALRAGAADVLAVWKFDRWSRQGLGAVARLFDVIEERKDTRPPGALRRPPRRYPVLRPSWRLHVSLVAEIGHIEGENTKIRVKSTRKYLRDERRHTGRLPYGYRSVPHPSGKGRALEVNPEEAAIVRRMADMVLDGHTSYTTARRLNDEGILPRTAPRWTSALVTDQLKRDSLNGYMTHRAKGDSSRTRPPDPRRGRPPRASLARHPHPCRVPRAPRPRRAPTPRSPNSSPHMPRTAPPGQPSPTAPTSPPRIARSTNRDGVDSDLVSEIAPHLCLIVSSYFSFKRAPFGEKVFLSIAVCVQHI